MRRAERFYREMMLAGRSMGHRRRLPIWAERALGAAFVAGVLAALCWAFVRALDGEAALWEVGDYRAPEPEAEEVWEEVAYGFE